HVAESHQLGSVIAEFPTTFEAAEASRKHGMNVLMGAPNIVRGVIVAGERNLSRAAQGGDGFAIRLRPACGERQLLFFVLLH
ncbi:hypothetical protein ACSLOB_30175, partial [Escherichia coli]